MKNVRFNYLNGTEWKIFNTRKAFKEWAQDEQHNGVYIVSYTNMTNRYNRAEILEILK